MISASSSVASGLLSAYFRNGSTPAGSTLGVGTSGAAPGESATPASANAMLASEDATILGGSLGGTESAVASFLSNAAFAQITIALLRNPAMNGALTGKVSSNVLKIIQQIGGAEGAAAASAYGTGTDAGTGTGGLPSGGVLA